MVPRTTDSTTDSASPAPAGGDAGGRYRWLVCGLLFLATTINYIDRQILVADQADPRQRARTGRTPNSVQVNSAFQVAYAVSLLLFGVFIDRFGAKIGYARLDRRLEPGGRRPRAGRQRRRLHRRARRRWASARAATSRRRSRRSRSGSRSGSARFATALFNSGANVGAIVAPAIVPAHRGDVGLARRRSSSWASSGSPGCCSGCRSTTIPRSRRGLSRDELASHPLRRRPSGAAGSEPLPWRAILRYRQAWSFIVAKFAHRSGLVVLPHLAARLLQEDAGARHQEQLGSPGHDLRDHHRAQHRGRLAHRLPRAPRLDASRARARRRCSSSPAACCRSSS